MAITKVINDAVDLNQTSDYSGLRLPVGTTSDVVETFTTDYLVVGGGGSGSLQGAGGAGGLRTSYNNSTTTTNSLNFPSGKTAIATYMLDNNATDISGNYNGTEVNITYNTGKYGGAAIFNGSSSYINLGSTIDDPLRTSGEFGVSLWVNINSYTLNSPIIKLLNDIYLLILYNSSNEIECRVLNSSGVQSTITYSVSLNTWYHIVWTGNSTNGVTLYLNGFSVGNAAWNGTFFTYTNTNYKLNTLGYNGAGAGYYDGKIDQVRIYDSALSSTDVSNIYNNEAQANSGGGTVAESSLTLTGGTAYDVTVGAGGIDTYTSGGSSSNGASSIFSTITSLGGGGAGATSGGSTAASGKNGGSGGGAGSNTSGSPGNGTLGQGYIGGTALFYGGSYAGGGGGGALSPGGNSASNTVAGNGGSQLNLAITGTSIGYAGGGAGSLYGTGTVGTNDSSGGPAAPSSGSSASGGSAPYNLGGGGGGANHRSGTTNIFGGSGGSGVVILRYPTASVSSFTTTGTLNTPSTTDTLANNNYPVTNTAYYTLDGNANGYLTTNDLGTLDYPSGTGCVALYELNGNANDTSNTYNGSASSITYNTGAFGQAAVFNGSSSKIALNSSISSIFTDNFTFSAWVYPADNSNYICLFSAEFGMELYFYQGQFQLYSNNTNNGTSRNIFNFGTTITNYAINQWYHVALVFTKTSQAWYINGQQNGTNTTSSYTPYQASLISIGYFERQDGGANHYVFNGLIDQVRVFNTALTANNITTLARGAGTAYSGAASNVTWANGRFGQAAVFNGSSSRIELPTSTFSPSTFSLSAWCNVTSDTDENTIIELVDNQTYPNNTTIVLSAGSTGYSSRFLLRNYTTNQYNYNPSGTVSKNVWKHYAMTYDGSTVKSYIDGSLVDSGSLTLSNTVGAISSIQIGLSSGNRHLNGSIDQVRIYSTALTSSQVTQLYEEHYQTKFTDGSDTAIVFTEGTGTVTFSGVDPAPPQGALRTNTSYSEDGSASVIEHYNGADWKYFDAIKYCTTNTLNFPSGAGCIASYNLDNNVYDIGNTYNGLNSNVTFNASGKFGAAAVFNGSSSKISFSSSPIPSSGAFTVSAWVKTSVSNHCFISFGDFWLKAEYLSGVFSLGDINTSFQGTTNISDGNWHHCVLTVDNSNNIALYVDGTSEDTGTSAISRTNGGSFVIGVARNSSPVYWWNGSIDQVRIFNDSLTSDEVLKLYNNEIACS